jgi:hypothetical protein
MYQGFHWFVIFVKDESLFVDVLVLFLDQPQVMGHTQPHTM